MPGMDGLEASRQILQRVQERRVAATEAGDAVEIALRVCPPRIVALTAAARSDDEATKNEWRRAGVESYAVPLLCWKSMKII